MTSTSDLVERLREAADRVAKRAMGHDVPALISIPRRETDVDSILCEAADALTAANKRAGEVEKERNALAEDRARFPNKPDGIGRMVEAHIGNLKAGKRSSDDFANQWHARMVAAESLASSLQAQVEALTKALRNLLSCEYDGHGLTDCIDNHGKHYPSAYLYEQIKAAEALLLNQGETDRLASAEDNHG